jgi:periplasmic copper chaperone A
MSMKLHNLIVASGFIVLVLLNHASAGEHITVQNAWLREAPPTLKVMAAYLDIENSSDKELILIAAESAEFERIEFHHSRIENSVARMQQQERIVIPANTTFKFKPESYHLMFFNNAVPMREGKVTSIKLFFENGETHTFDAAVKKKLVSSESHNHDHH